MMRTTEEILLDLLDALRRKDTEQDGNWGWPSFEKQVAALHAELKRGVRGDGSP